MSKKEEETPRLVNRLRFYTERAIQIQVDAMRREFEEQCEKWGKQIEEELVKAAKGGKNELIRFFDPRPANEMIAFLCDCFKDLNAEPVDRNGKFSITFYWPTA
jgi:hypothetical protein